jgi:hypothetical protein
MPNTPDLSEEFKATRNAFTVHASDVRHGVETLFHEWYQMKVAGARCTVDPTSGVTFSDVVEAVIACRVSGSPLVWPTGKGK